MKRLSFYVDKEIHYVTIERTKNKNMYLKVKGKDIIVSAPKLTMERTIQKFVSLHIEKFVKYINDKKEFELYSISDKYIFLNGKKQDYKILTGFKMNQLIKKNENIYIETKTGSDDEIEKAIKAYLKYILIEYLNKRQIFYESAMGIPPHQIRVVYKTSTWGTNMIGKKKISYSSKLAHFSNDVIDYVIVHELAHFIEPNHSKNFWKVVEDTIPNYKDVKKQLRADVGLE